MASLHYGIKYKKRSIKFLVTDAQNLLLVKPKFILQQNGRTMIFHLFTLAAQMIWSSYGLRWNSTAGKWGLKNRQLLTVFILLKKLAVVFFLELTTFHYFCKWWFNVSILCGFQNQVSYVRYEEKVTEACKILSSALESRWRTIRLDVNMSKALDFLIQT